MRIKWATLVAVLLGIGLSHVAGPLHAQLPMPVSTQFDITGFLQEASVGGAGTGSGVGALQGGVLKVNGQRVIVPSNTIVILPASAYTWQELFALSPAPYTGVASGLAMADLPAPLTTWEVHVVGNRVGDTYIAGLMDIHQNSLNSGAGFINFMDYATGEMRVGGVLGNSATGTRLRLSDPIGRFGRDYKVAGVFPADARFAVDDANPTMAAGTGFPMCFPRTRVDLGIDDPICPQGNRPPAIAPAVGFASVVQMNNPALAGNPPPDARQQAPFEVGDYITFAGTLVADAGITPGPTAGPWPGEARTYISAHTISSNVAIYTWPGTNPAYVSIEVSLIGTGGLTVLGAGEAAVRTRFEGMTTDPSRNIHLYGVDMVPGTGATTDRDFGTIGVDPGPGGGIGAVKGRWRFRPPCTAAVATDKDCTPPPAGTFLPPPREVRAVIEGQQTQVPGLLGAQTSANGIFYGQYHAPIGEYIFPENIPGSPIVQNNFNELAFLAQGGYSSSTGVVAGVLDPWPSDVTPTPACTAPAASSGGPYTVASLGTITLSGSATGTGPFAYSWSADIGTLSNTAIANPTYTAPATGPANLTFTVVGACGSSTVTTTVAINAPASPTVSAVPPIAIFSGGSSSFVVTGTDPNVPTQALTFTVTQAGVPALTALTVTKLNSTSSRVDFTAPVLPIGQVTSTSVSLTITAKNTSNLTSAPTSTTITINPLPDVVLVTNAQYRTGKIRLVITATSSVVSPNVILKLNPYVCAVPNAAGAPPCPGGIFDPSTLGNTFTNTGNGIYTITLVGAPEPAVPPAAPLTAKSNLGTTSPPHGLDRISK